MKTRISTILLLIGISFLGSIKAFAQPQEITLATGEQFDAALELIRQKGFYHNILRRYGVQESILRDKQNAQQVAVPGNFQQLVSSIVVD